VQLTDLFNRRVNPSVNCPAIKQIPSSASPPFCQPFIGLIRLVFLVDDEANESILTNGFRFVEQ